jgi:GT2 family glycosyltransferase/SAM-dependent methyltransferase/glycosyltransferase involved in cell wall biosynthesis
MMDEPPGGAAARIVWSRRARLADGMFAIPRAEEALPFTGERMTGAVAGQIEMEHLHRYCLARDLCAGLDVLDVASGEGYGAALMAGVARSVVGVEIDAASVAHAARSYARPNLRFATGDATCLPLADACVDAVVSFETLEHLDDQEAFLTEVRRVLRPGGLFLVSTPDRQVYSAPGQPVNPHHVLELTEAEFRALLGRHFAHHALLAQRALLGSVLAPLDDPQGWRSYDRRAADRMEAQPGLSRAFYLLAAASDGPLPALPASVLAERVPPDEAARAPDLLRERHAMLAEIEAGRGREAAAQAALVAAGRATEEARRAGAEQVGNLERRLAEVQGALQEVLAAQAQTAAATSPLAASPYPRSWIGRQFRRARLAGIWALQGELPWRLRLWWGVRQARALPEPPRGGENLRAALGLPPALATPRPEDIALPPLPEAPRVSVIIPTYGQVDHTLRCLASLAAHPPQAPCEIIVVDDAAPDPRAAELARVANIRLVRNTENLGFLRSCNAAANEARGELLFFLNNDTEVMPGAVDALVRLLDARPDAGMVGARLLYPDGTQQEAGGIVWNDGSAWNYGRGDDPRKPEYNYVREADYCSGAAIMLSRALWERLGGFDEHYLPAYCEDTDLAFRVREAGLKVLYQPAAMIIHDEGTSHGTDVTQGVKAHQVANMRKLAARWAERLATEQQAPGTRIPMARDRATGRKVTLVIDHYVPTPDQDGGSRAMFSVIEALCASGRVVKFFPQNELRTPGYTEALQALGVEVAFAPYSRGFANWIAERGAEVDEVLLSRPTVAVEFLPTLKRHCAAPIVFLGHDLHHLRMRLDAEALGDPARRAAAAEMERIERAIWRDVAVSVYFSEEEIAMARSLEPVARFGTMPLCALPSPPTDRAPPAAPRILFVGGFGHPPNIDAAKWLAGEIFPRILAARPDARLTLAGSKPPAEVQALASPEVEVTGFLPEADLARRYGEARVALCPLRVGAGVKVKVIEAMSHALPVVTTSIGAQGLEGLARVADVADTAEGLASATLRLLGDDALWKARSAAQADYVLERFTPDVLRAAMERAFAAAHGAQPPRG